MGKLNTDYLASFDGTRLAVHRMGAGRPVLLLHGLFSSADMNWIKFGHATQLADAGFEAIMLDFRAHGQSAAPHDPSAYPQDVLARDVQYLVEQLGLQEFDLVGFSLGARTAVHAVIAGLCPGRLVLSGMGLEGLSGWHKRAGFFIDAIDRFDHVKRGDPAFYAVSFMKTMKVDRVAARLLLQSVGDVDAQGLARVTSPTMVLCGDEDRDNGSPTALVEALPRAHHQEIPGTHMGCVTGSALGRELVSFLGEGNE